MYELNVVMKSLISDLRLKFAKKSWNETFLLVRRCMDKSRDETRACEPLVRSLERLQEVFNGPSMSVVTSRLETIAKHQGMGFHVTEGTCYLTADLFYLEVLLQPCGGVEEVKVAPHGGSPVSSESLLQLLRSKHFAEFSMKLEGLLTQYNMPGNSEMKLKLFASLQYLRKDLQEMSHLPRVPEDGDPLVDLINNGLIGCLIAGKEDFPMTLQFFMAPTDGQNTSVSYLEPVVQAAQLAVGLSDATHKLQMASVVPLPLQLDPQGYPVFTPPGEAPHELLPACFLLKLQPAVPMMMAFVSKIRQSTDVTVPDVDLQWAPFPKLLMRRSPGMNYQETDEQDTIFTVALPGDVMHSYIFPEASWETPSHRGTMMDSIPFTHPVHVPTLVELLRHQCAINTLLRSCVCGSPGSACDLQFEVRLESDTSFSVTFLRPNVDSLAVLLVNISNSHQITCNLFGPETGDPSVDEYVSDVLRRCVSIPLTLCALFTKLQPVTSAPLSPGPSASTETENDHSRPSSAAASDTSIALTTSSQGAVVPAASLAVSAPACYTTSLVKSELLPEINASPGVNPYPSAPVGVFSRWMTSNGTPPELM